MVEQAFYDGSHNRFMHYIESYNIELWKTRFLFETIERDDVLYTRDRCDAHYELVRDVLQKSIEEKSHNWDSDDIVEQWIHLLVERKYPWFVCSVWNHLRPTAVSILHHASMIHCHPGNLHQLVYQKLIAHIWEDVDFLCNLGDQNDFFTCVEHTHKSFRKFFRKQLVHFPFDDVESVEALLSILVGLKCTKTLRCLLNCSHSADIYDADPHLLFKLCRTHDAKLLDTALAHYSGPLTVGNWHRLFFNVHEEYITSWKQHPLDNGDTTVIFELLLHTAHERLDAAEWLELIATTTNNSFLSLFMHCEQAATLLDIIHQHTIQAMEAVPADHITCFEMRNVQFHWSGFAKDSVLNVVDALSANINGWTAFANALRWGVLPSVRWFLDRCPNDEFLTGSMRTAGMPARRDNALSLALYNPEPKIYKQLLRFMETKKKEVTKWVLQDNGKLVSIALTRLSFFHPQEALTRFLHLFTLCPDLCEKKNELLEAFVNEWYNHYAWHNSSSWNEAESLTRDHPILDRLLSLPQHITNANAVTILLRSSKGSAFRDFVNYIFTTNTSTDFVKDVYIDLVHQSGCDSEECLMAVEAVSSFKTMMRTTQPDAYRFYMAWSKHSVDEFKSFHDRMKHLWHQPHRLVMPANYSYYACTHMRIHPHCETVPDMWRTWISLGLVPLFFVHKMNWSHTPTLLHQTLKVLRFLRRCLQRKYRCAHHRQQDLHQRKKMRFMVKCNPRGWNGV